MSISFCAAVGRKLPKTSLSLQPRPDGVTLKDTFVNIRDSGELVTNLGHAATGPRSASIGFRLDPDVDEFEAVGVERANCEVVRAPRIKGAPIALECVVDRIFAVGDLNNHVVWANVVRFHVRDEVLLENGRVDIGAPYR